ncbi:MAG: antitoxin [Myxococcota bacterium]
MKNYLEVKRIAEALDWSIAEVLRRGAEHMVNAYPSYKTHARDWLAPKAQPLGRFQAPVSAWRELAHDA